MKFRCEREILAEALATAGRAATSRTGTLPVLSGVRLDVSDGELTVTGTDLELTIRLSVPVHSDRDGSAVVPARLVADIVKALPAGAVEVSVDDDEMSISAGRSQFSVRPLSLSDYPAQVEPDAEPVTLSSDQVADALRQVVRAASTDDARAVLTGVLIASEDDGLKMVATDSYRLAVRDLPQSSMLAAGQKVLVPSRALAELQRIVSDDEDLTVRLGAREAVFEAGGTRLTTRLIEGEYPNYRNLLPSSYPNTLDRRSRSAARGVASREDPGAGLDPGPSDARRRHVAAHGDHPGRRQRGRGDRRQLRGCRDDGGVQPRLSGVGHRRGRRRRGHARRRWTR